MLWALIGLVGLVEALWETRQRANARETLLVKGPVLEYGKPELWCGGATSYADLSHHGVQVASGDDWREMTAAITLDCAGVSSSKFSS